MINEEFSDGESRRLLYVKPGFQRKMMIIMILVIIAVNIVMVFYVTGSFQVLCRVSY